MLLLFLRQSHFLFMVVLGIRNWSVYVKEKRNVLVHVSELTKVDAFDNKKKKTQAENESVSADDRLCR
nr:hypothetical protein [Planococcus glaciei]